MRIKIWPFLVSKNCFLDHGPVVVPSFLTSTREDVWLLADVAGGDATPTNQYLVRDVFDNAKRVLTVLYRVVQATDDNGLVVRDDFDRPILWIEGGVTTDTISFMKESFDPNDLARLHEYLKLEFWRFWNKTDRDQLPVPSSSMDFVLESGNTSDLVLIPEEPYSRPSGDTPKSLQQRGAKNPMTNILERIVEFIRKAT